MKGLGRDSLIGAWAKGNILYYMPYAAYDMSNICHINATFSMFISKNIKGEMISPGNYNPPFEWKDGSGPGSMVRPWSISYGAYQMVHFN